MPQYHFPFANPPKAISPTSATMSPIQKLQMSMSTIPTITRMPPRPIPPVFPPVRSANAYLLMRYGRDAGCFHARERCPVAAFVRGGLIGAIIGVMILLALYRVALKNKEHPLAR